MIDNTSSEQHHYFTHLQARFDTVASTSNTGDEQNLAFFDSPPDFSSLQGWGLDTIFKEEQNHEDIDPLPKNIVELGNAGDDNDDEDSTAINLGTSG